MYLITPDIINLGFVKDAEKVVLAEQLIEKILAWVMKVFML